MGFTDEQVVGVPQTVKIKHQVNFGRPVRNVTGIFGYFFWLLKKVARTQAKRCETALKERNDSLNRLLSAVEGLNLFLKKNNKIRPLKIKSRSSYTALTSDYSQTAS
jgi:hypothetical protein